MAPFILKHGDTFAAFDPLGDIDGNRQQPLGLFHQDTRFLSRLKLRVGAQTLRLTGSTIDEDSSLQIVDLATDDGLIQVSRRRFLWQSTLHERVHIQNMGRVPLNVSLFVDFDVDFVDLFVLRGLKRKRCGRLLPLEIGQNWVRFAYEGLDNRTRHTSILFEQPPDDLSESHGRFDCGGGFELTFSVRCGSDEGLLSYDEATKQIADELRKSKEEELEISTTNPELNAWLNRSRADLRMMLTQTRQGVYPYAGLPWYNTAFGRDGIVTALECLWFDPAIARGVLSFLAATQATEENPERDAQPGKILHEMRSGETAASGEVPFGRYYGSIDATPLFIVLAGSYYERTGDTAFVESIWLNIERALFWIDDFGDPDGDGFYEYVSKSPRGLTNQGWKDSPGAVFHQNGALAEPPIALCEVQAYVFAAKRTAAKLAHALQRNAVAENLERESEALRRRFEDVFWCETLATYGLALDRRKRLCRVLASNAGHCLFAGIASEEYARRTAATLMDENFFSGWGIRTVANTEARFDPSSYHNGSVWPHDNAIIAAGFARYGLIREAEIIFSALFDAAKLFDFRLPEVFCGFRRKSGEGVVPHAAACSPQTWASCAVFLLLRSCVELEINGPQRRVCLTSKHRPPLSGITICIGERALSLTTGGNSD
jgi:glycogen debranching enzyme